MAKINDRDHNGFSESDVLALAEFKAEGLSGLSSVNDHQVDKMRELYQDGTPFVQIARILRVRKAIVLYHAEREGWHEAKLAKLNDLSANLKRRTDEAKIASLDFLTKLAVFYERRITAQISRVKPQGEDSVDKADVDRFLKILAMLSSVSDDVAAIAATVPQDLKAAPERTQKLVNGVGSFDILQAEHLTHAERIKALAEMRRKSERR